MDDQLKAKLLEILNAAQQAGGDAYEYVKQEAPELAREIVLWRVVEHAMWLLCGLLLLGAAGWIIRQIKTGWDEWQGGDTRVALYPVLLPFALVIGMAVSGISTTALLQAHFAPRVFFLKSCKELLK